MRRTSESPWTTGVSCPAQPFRMRFRGTTNNRLPETSVNLMEVGPDFFDPEFETNWSDFTDEGEQVKIWMSTRPTGFNVTAPQRLPGTIGDPKRGEWEPPSCPGALIVVAEDLDPQIVREARACITINDTAPVSDGIQSKQKPLYKRGGA